MGAQGSDGAGTINPCVTYQRTVDDVVDEYLMGDLPQEIKPAASWEIASLSLVKAEDDSAASALC